ncbi:MAG TPA: hypothetical protein VNN18_03535 [Candidatus Xenobia bacterium]|nr:hypothetical protein [Candidatus Xenobia bacterium]
MACYDGAELRVKKQVGSTTTVYIFSGSKVIAEYASGAAPTSPTREYIYAGSQLVATLQGSTTTYVHPDHLSARLFTDSNGQNAGGRGHLPFGEVWYDSMASDKWKFTTYERDSESGLDYAMFRFDSTRLGRRPPRLQLFQRPDHLHFAILPLRHAPLLSADPKIIYASAQI